MRAGLTLPSILALCLGQQATAEFDLGWAEGVGTMFCAELEIVPDAELTPWVQGYWTGANLYLGGSDLCLERGALRDLGDAEIRALLRIHCAGFEGSPIMTAAFNALKGLPPVPGSRAATCGGETK